MDLPASSQNFIEREILDLPASSPDSIERDILDLPASSQNFIKREILDFPASSQSPIKREILDLPASSQSHFARFQNFAPNHDAPFDDEFSRLASSQDWVPGSQKYSQERTIALSQELKLHYFTPLQPLDSIDEEITEEEKLRGYQSLCEEVGIPPSDSIEKCKKQLKSTLVNIVDLVDAVRTGKKVKVWDDFDAFCNYTLHPGRMISREKAREDGGYLESLLQDLRGSRHKRQRRRKKKGVGARAAPVQV